jgi:hypothetical protein
MWVSSSKDWCKKITEDDNMGEWNKTHELLIQLNDELKAVGGSIVAIEDTIGLLDKYNTFNIIFGKPREKADWEIRLDEIEAEKELEAKVEIDIESTEELIVPSKCLIVDDEDEKQIPIAKSPIDSYRGSGKKCSKCFGVKDSADCFEDCKKCYDKSKIIPKCLDCNKSITYGDYVRCFSCNRAKWIKEQDAKAYGITTKCLIEDD